MFGLIIPVFNFAEGLPTTFSRLSAWRKLHPDFPFKVCFVNDGSRDDTRSVLDEFAAANHDWAQCLHLAQHQGKGACIRAGFLQLAPHCPQILFTDCDLYYGLDLVPAALDELKSCDIVILDRSLFGSYGKRSRYRNLASRAFNKFICLLTGVSFFDTQAGFKAFRTDICLPIFKHLKIRRFAFDVELLAHATKYLLRIHALPVTLSSQKQQELQKSTIRLTTGFEVVLDILRIGRIVSQVPPFDEELKEKLKTRTHRV